MIHPFFVATRPLVFAHRGGAALAPENTLAAFDRGMSLGADGLELDVRLSRDGVVMVIHDATLERTTNRRGRVCDATADDLSRADAGHRFAADGSTSFRGQGHGVPRLADVLSRYPTARIIIELKEATVELARATIDVVRAARAVNRVCLGAFGRRALKAARVLEPSVATSASREEARWALYRSWIGWPVSRVSYNGYQVCETTGRTRVVSPHFIEVSHRAGLPVQVWTVDDPDEARRLLSWGVDGLITDRPDLIVPLVQRS